MASFVVSEISLLLHLVTGFRGLIDGLQQSPRIDYTIIEDVRYIQSIEILEK